MNTRSTILVAAAMLCTVAALPSRADVADLPSLIDRLTPEHLRHAATDTLAASDSIAPAIQRLTDDDYREVAAELGVDVAAIKAVVDIEAGRSHQGFHAPSMPLINFDLTMFRRFAAKRGVNLANYYRTHAVVFARPNSARHGSHQAAQHARLAAARAIHPEAAVEGTFWGMFQIGGFNWRKCGAQSIDDFVWRMGKSEREQLELFARFITNTGLLPHLKSKNWAAFARGYNGASYARQNYHTRLAAAYKRHKEAEAD